AASELGAVVVTSDADVTHDLLDRVSVDNRPNVRLWIGAVADAQSFRGLHQFRHKLLVSFLVDHEPRRRSATLARSTKRAPDRALDREIDVGIVHHDDRALAAHFERADRVSLGARRSDDAAGFG